MKIKLSSKERRAGIDLRDVLPSAAKPKSPTKEPRSSNKTPVDSPPPEFRAIEWIETTLHDPIRDRWEKGCDEGSVRLYCSRASTTDDSDDARWNLQVRARVKKKTGGAGKHFAVGTASMSREDLQWLRALIDAELRRNP